MNWKRVALILGSAAAGLTAVFPPTAVVTIPILGKIGTAALMSSVGAFLTGWATKTPGHGPVDQTEK